MKFHYIALIVCVFVLGGCAFGQGVQSEKTEKASEDIYWQPQLYSGLTNWKIEYDKDGNVRNVTGWDGKEKTDVTLNVTRNADGSITLEYAAKGVQAFEGQGIRANVETGIVEAGNEVAAETVKGIVEILKPVSILP